MNKNKEQIGIFLKTLDRKNIRVRTRNKVPQEKDWIARKEYLTIDQLLKIHGEYGLRGGVKIGKYFFFVIDIDQKGWTKICSYLSYVKSNRGIHIYCLLKDVEPIKNYGIFFEKKRIGDIISAKKQVLGPLSKNKSGNFYQWKRRGKWFKKFNSLDEFKKWLAKFDLEIA